MAEAIVSIVLQKLAGAAIQEAIFLYGVNDQVEFVKRELIRIKCFLKDADSKGKGDNRVENWVKEVRGVSYWIEDVIDTYLAEVWIIDIKEDGQSNKFNRLRKKPMKLIFKHKLGKALNKIQRRIKEISASRETYGIQNLGESSNEPVKALWRPVVVPDTEIEIIGFDAEKNDIIKLLLDESTLQRRVVSIVGQGGLGKTTLAQKIYNSPDVKDNFGCQIWLTVSQEFKPIELLKDILRKLGGENNDETARDEGYFAAKINEKLKKRKYLIVLDDIWDNNAWSDLLQPSFPDMKNGSRVLITTRFLNIAMMADLKGVYELRLLNQKESLELLLKKAIPKDDADKNYPQDLFELGEEFVKICDGLPLALVVVGGILSVKPPTCNAWKRVLKTMDWHGEGNKCIEIIATSYEDLPLQLKPCFIYLSAFPEDHEIDTDLLVQLWIAEGLIPDEAGKIMEDTAKNYLDELAQRCMIQVIQRALTDGSIKKIRLHDLLLDLAIHEAKEKEFIKVVSKAGDFQDISITRRATFQLSDWEDISFEHPNECPNPNIRTLFFNKYSTPFSCQLKLLTVLVVEELQCFGIPTWFNHLKLMVHLRFLAFKKCVFFNVEAILPVDNWHNLQTLILDHCRHITVPKSIWKIKTLRHIIDIPADFHIQDDEPVIGLTIAPANLPNLQTLNLGFISGSISGFLSMPNLRKLTLFKCLHSNWEAVIALLAKLDSLVSLHLAQQEEQFTKQYFPLEIFTFLQSYRSLHTLILQGKWPETVTLNDDTFPPHLTKLELSGSYISQNIIAVLEKLHSLKILHMFSHSYTGKKIICTRGGFPQLQILELFNIRKLRDWEIEEGAMPVLKKLTMKYSPKLQEVPNWQNLTTLKVLDLVVTTEIGWRLRNEDEHIIKHIPSVTLESGPLYDSDNPAF